MAAREQGRFCTARECHVDTAKHYEMKNVDNQVYLFEAQLQTNMFLDLGTVFRMTRDEDTENGVLYVAPNFRRGRIVNEIDSYDVPLPLLSADFDLTTITDEKLRGLVHNCMGLTEGEDLETWYQGLTAIAEWYDISQQHTHVSLFVRLGNSRTSVWMKPLCIRNTAGPQMTRDRKLQQPRKL